MQKEKKVKGKSLWPLQQNKKIFLRGRGKFCLIKQQTLGLVTNRSSPTICTLVPTSAVSLA